MSTNQELRLIFEQMAAAIELLGGESFRATAYYRVARELKSLGEDLGTFVAAGPADASRRLASLPGVGKGSARRILEYLEHGRIAEHQELLEQVPSGLFEVLQISGLGPKAVQLLWHELGVTSLADLKGKLDSSELAELPRMGAKTIENIRQAIAFKQKSKDRVGIGVARPIAEALVAELSQLPGVARIDYAGSLRRGRDTIGDIDLVVACREPAAVRERFTSLPAVKQVLARGETKSSVRLEVDRVALQADLRVVPAAAYGAALLYFTGSKEHNVRLREIAIKQDRHLNEYGLFAGTEERPQDRSEPPLAAASEQEIYDALGLTFVPPELREDRGELDAVPDDLVELAQVKAELHAHTVASDGRLTIAELAAVAKARGLHTLAITDHSQSSVIAGGLTADRLRRHLDDVRAANDEIPGITLLAGAEVDILPNGDLDYDDELLAQLDIVVASPHVSLRQSTAAATERLLAAIRHPLVHIIGHPTGRIVGRREGLAPDLATLLAAAAEHDTVLEINANPRRLDLRDQHVAAAVAHGCKLAINTDAHVERDLDFLVYGVLTARRGGLGHAACLNTWPARKLHAWLRRKR